MSDHLCVVCSVRPCKGDSELCGGCFVRLRVELATVQWAHDWLGVAMAASGVGPDTGVVHRSAESRPPYRLDITDARTDIEAKLASWARMIGEEHFPPLAGPLDATVPGICTWLRARLPWCSDQPWVDSFLAELAELRRMAYGLAPWDRTRTDMPLPCPACTLLSLSLYGGDDAVVCRARDCGHVMTAYEYKREVDEWMQRRRLEIAENAMREAPDADRGAAPADAPPKPLAVREGSLWCWQPLKPDARIRCRITAVNWNGEEWWIEAENTQTTRGGERGARTWNTLDSWVESAVLVRPGPQEVAAA